MSAFRAWSRRQHDRAHDLPLLRRRLRHRGRGRGAARRYSRIRPISAGCAPRARRSKDTLALPGRLLTPMLFGREAGWDEALDFIAAEFSRIRAAHGPEAIAFYVSGQFLTEDYYVANKLMKGFIGAGNIDTNSRLCMASSVAGHVRAFGEDVVPGCYEDLGGGRSGRPGRQQHGLVPSGALPAADGGARDARHQDRRHRSAPHRDGRHRRSASAARARQRRGAVQRPAGASGGSAARSTATGSRRHVDGLRRGAGGGAAVRRPRSPRSRRRPILRSPTCGASTTCSPAPSGW